MCLSANLQERVNMRENECFGQKNTMFITVVSFMKSEGDTIASLNKALARYTR